MYACTVAYMNWTSQLDNVPEKHGHVYLVEPSNTVSCNQMGSILAEKSSWTALTRHIGKRTAFCTKNMKSKHIGIFIMKILNSKSDGGKCILKEM